MPVTSSKPFKVAIVGGGLAGLTLAVGLLKHGVPVHIYESASAFSEIGAGVAFGPNSVRALGLVDEKILAGYKRHATYNESPERRNTWLSFRWGTRHHISDGEPDREPGDLIFHLEDSQEWDKWTGTRTRSCIHRAKLLDELIKLIPEGTTSFGKALANVEELPKGGVRLSFQDGTEATADAAIGCDGIKSKTREMLYGPSIQPEFCKEYVYRALVPRKDAIEALGEELTLNGQLYCGLNRYIITYSVEHGSLLNMVAVVRKDDLTWDDTQWIHPSTKGDMLKDFEGWHPGIIKLITRFETRDKWAMYHITHEEKYNKGSVCLLGDSAHASTPHLGAGAGMAMEDSFILSSLLGACQQKEDLSIAFEAFDAVRRPRTQRLVRESLTQSTVYQLVKDSVLDDPGKFEAETTDRYHWVWHEDLEAQLARAVAHMRSHR